MFCDVEISRQSRGVLRHGGHCRAVRNTSELESVVAAQARAPNSGVIVMPDAFMSAHRAEVTSLLARHRLPAVSPYRFYTELGGLLSYGNDIVDNYRRVATYVRRIFKGAKPSELPGDAPASSRRIVRATYECGWSWT